MTGDVGVGAHSVDEPRRARSARAERPFDVQWTETMRGTVVAGADGYDPSTHADAGHGLRFSVHGTIGSFDRFLTDDEHIVELDGTVECRLVGGGPFDVRDGSLHLLRPTSSPAVLEMLYVLPFTGADGRRFELAGIKTVRDDRGFDVWADTSTLDVVLRAAPAGGQAGLPPTEAFARGRLRISVLGFLSLLLGMRAAGGGPLSRRIWSHVVLRARFVWWFLGRLVHIYGNPFRVGSSSTQIAVDRVGRRIRADKAALGFRPRARVRWASPRTLVRTGVQLLTSGSLGDQLDVRRYEPPGNGVSRQLEGEPELWLDFVADTGDGFASTYSVAYVVSRPTLDVGGRHTERGQALVLGGDLVYPTPTREEYEDRTRGPWEAAMPFEAADRHLVFAIPGNHDWYDSLNAYQHAFMGQGRRLGARRFVQEQSYFAAELPHGWWLLGVDIALAQRVDDRQVAFVRGAIAQMDGDARVILVIAKPAWLDDPLSRGSRNLAFVESLLPAGSLRLVLTGDVHHYARYATAADGPTRITCGGGGAYTAGTHRLPAQLAAAWRPDHRSDAPSLQAVSPSRETSKWMRRHVVGAFVGQPTFVATVGILVLVLDVLLLSGDAAASASTIDRLRAASFGEAWGAAVRGLAHAPLAAVGFGAVAVALITLAVALRQPVRVLPATLLGVAHAGAQLTVILATLWWLLHLDMHGTAGALVVAAGVPIIGGVTASLLCGLYLLAADRMVRHSAISFAVQGRTEWKSFARLHVDADGNLELFAVGLPQVVKTWARNPAAGPDRPDPRLVPTAPRRDLGVDARDDALGEPPFVTLIERVVL